ncbi:hypothetical protein FRC20_004677 [Serendipita sp. 405]|nr:hypothetical protein FRC15_002419 [Serendipita sp. 397]KAG8842026.1 hypothetical protein FRC20_004677 [Serendipita sp. 405]
MHFVKVLILPAVFALTVSAAPIPAPSGNMVSLETRCRACPHNRSGQHGVTITDKLKEYNEAARKFADTTHK